MGMASAFIHPSWVRRLGGAVLVAFLVYLYLPVWTPSLFEGDDAQVAVAAEQIARQGRKVEWAYQYIPFRGTYWGIGVVSALFSVSAFHAYYALSAVSAIVAFFLAAFWVAHWSGVAYWVGIVSWAAENTSLASLRYRSPQENPRTVEFIKASFDGERVPFAVRFSYPRRGQKIDLASLGRQSHSQIVYLFVDRNRCTRLVLPSGKCPCESVLPGDHVFLEWDRVSGTCHLPPRYFR